MKRKLDKNKVYAFMGRITVELGLWAGTVLSAVWAFENCITVYR